MDKEVFIKFMGKELKSAKSPHIVKRRLIEVTTKMKSRYESTSEINYKKQGSHSGLASLGLLWEE